MKQQSKPDIQLYSYCLESKYPLPVLGDHLTKRYGFLLIQKKHNGYRIGEAAPLPSFHKASHSRIQEELTYFVQYQTLPSRCHSLSQFAVDMLIVDKLYKKQNIYRNINALYNPMILNKNIDVYQSIKLKVGRKSFLEDIEVIESILERKPNIRIRLDPNCLWSYRDSLFFWELLSKKSLESAIEYIEDPVQDIQNISRLNKIPYALDTLFSIPNLIYNPVAIVLKPTLQGGWIYIQKLQTQLRQQYPKLRMILSSTFESSIGINAIMNLADPNEIHGLGTLEYFAYPCHDLVHNTIKQEEDRIISTNKLYMDEDIRWDLLEKL